MLFCLIFPEFALWPKSPISKQCLIYFFIFMESADIPLSNQKEWLWNGECHAYNLTLIFILTGNVALLSAMFVISLPGRKLKKTH